MKNLSKIFGRAGRKSEVSANVSSRHGHEDSHQHNHQHEEHLQLNKGFQCPMKCEGDKVYASLGNCPVCNMKLVSLEDKKQGHHHGCC
jgi:hypothetical protein